jgi:hypothetical protein
MIGVIELHVISQTLCVIICNFGAFKLKVDLEGQPTVKPEAWSANLRNNLDNTIQYCYLVQMLPSWTISSIQDQAYACHPGNQPGVACSFHFLSPPRAKIIPYSYLLSIDVLGDRLITLHYSFADVEISLGRDFAGKNQFLDDFANFRVSAIRESSQLRLQILAETDSEKTQLF